MKKTDSENQGSCIFSQMSKLKRKNKRGGFCKTVRENSGVEDRDRGGKEEVGDKEADHLMLCACTNITSPTTLYSYDALLKRVFNCLL